MGDLPEQEAFGQEDDPGMLCRGRFETDLVPHLCVEPKRGWGQWGNAPEKSKIMANCYVDAACVLMVLYSSL